MQTSKLFSKVGFSLYVLLHTLILKQQLLEITSYVFELAFYISGSTTWYQ